LVWPKSIPSLFLTSQSSLMVAGPVPMHIAFAVTRTEWRDGLRWRACRLAEVTRLDTRDRREGRWDAW
jgi:hypothetical protein